MSVDMTKPELHLADVNIGRRVVIWSWTITSIAAVVVVLRICIRATNRLIGLDDLAIGIAAAISVFGSVVNTLQVRHGLGRHFEFLSVESKRLCLMWTDIAQLQNFIALFFIRSSICIFLLRLLSRTHKNLRYAIVGAIGLNLAATILITFTFSFQCIPFAGPWDSSLAAHCYPKRTLAIVTRVFAVLGVVNDFITATVPMVLLWDLQINRKTRISLALVLCSGYAVAACAIGKTITSNEAATDPSFVLVAVEMWAISEENLEMIVASIPTMRMTFKTIEQKITSRLTSRVQRPGYANSHQQGPVVWVRKLEASQGRNIHDLENDHGSERDLVPGSTGLEVRKTTTIDVELQDLDQRDAPDAHGPYSWESRQIYE